MKKLFSLMTVLGLLLLCAPSFASSVGVAVNGGAAVGEASEINLPCDPASAITTDGFRYNIGCNSNFVSAGIANGGYTSMTTSGLAVPVSFSLVKKAIAASANTGFSTGTLPAGVPGQLLTIEITSVGTTGTWALTPAAGVVATGWSTITFNTAQQLATLLYLNPTVGWYIVSSDGSASGAAPTITDANGA